MISPVPKPSSAHSDLQDAFARWLVESRHWPSIQVYKEIELENGQRADVAKLTYPWDILDIYEIKVTRPDFLHEISSGKWEGYIDQCREVIFVTSHDLATLEEIPEGAGWIAQGPRGGFRRRKTGYQDPTFKVGRRQLQILLQRAYGG